jgi:arginyl-tRNA synthetase
MIDELLNLDELNTKTNQKFNFTISKIENVHIQSPSLIKFKNIAERKIYFNDLEKFFRNNQYIQEVKLNDAGFVNVILNIGEVLNYLQKSKSEIINLIKDGESKKYIFDYGGPNIGKSMHVGHLRPLNIGRALYNIYSISGHKTISDIHLGDWGVPIAQILSYCYENKMKIENVSVKDLQDIYPKASSLSAENDGFKKKVNLNLSMLNKKDQTVFSDWKTISETTIKNVKNILTKLNHSFDLFYGESTVVDIIPEMINGLKKDNLITLDDGALISTQENEPPILILKRDGTYLYMTTDLATVLDREKSMSPDFYFYIVDSRQSEHFKQLFSSVKYFNFSDSKFEHVGFGTINDPEGKPFKTRKGDVYPLEDLWKDIFNILSEKNESETAHILTNSVLVFSDLVIDRRSNYKFDIKKFTNVEGKTAIYLQYTRVRIKSILENAKATKYIDDTSENNISNTEVDLLISILKFSEVFQRARKLNEPHHLAEYVYEVCQKFNTMYKDIRIIGDDTLGIQNRRLNILITTLTIIDLVFEILGIQTVDKM